MKNWFDLKNILVNNVLLGTKMGKNRLLERPVQMLHPLQIYNVMNNEDKTVTNTA